ncbi:MAG TPA: ankyrin repeat domain-containing protein [Kofleriaceae bacterium]|nr:ankyrin repeat domain-containing protein [Kofleriaceae bacterium]
MNELIAAIRQARGPELLAALTQAKQALTPKTADPLTAAVAQAVISGHVTLDEADAIARWFLAAWKTMETEARMLVAIFGLVYGHLDDMLDHIVKQAPALLPVAKRMLETINTALTDDAALARSLVACTFFYFHTVEIEGEPIPVRTSGGVSTTDVIYERLAMTLTLSAPREDLWDFCMKLVAKVPTARGLPAKVKQVPKIDQFNDLDLEYMFALLEAGLSSDDPEIARAVTTDAIEQFEKQAPAKQQLISLARARPLADKQLLALSAFLATQPRIAEETATLASTWAAMATTNARAQLLATLKAAGIAPTDLPAPTPKDVLLALAGKRWADARAMLEAGVRMEDPGCRPDGAIHLVSSAPDEIRFPLIELMFARGLDVDDTGISGCTGLQRACDMRDHELARFLLEHGAWVDADMQRSTGHDETSLHVAVKHRDKELVQLLLAYGADPTIKDWNGETALDLASGEIKELLEQRPRG